GVKKDAARFLGMTFRSFRYRLAKYEQESVAK
ncbi:MAG: helix-turn-helix domain-containing protein, partial [Myxococcota bacterium]